MFEWAKIAIKIIKFGPFRTKFLEYLDCDVSFSAAEIELVADEPLRIDLKVGVVHLSCGVEDHLVGVSGADPEGNGEVTVDRFLQSVGSQVWSLTQFYSVDFSQSRISVKKCVCNKLTIKV